MTHFHRPFKNLEEMRNTIVYNWNSRVACTDTVYLLGDIGDISILGELKGKIIIVLGNHDIGIEDKIKKYYPSIEVSKYPIMVDGLWLSHEPITYMPPECPYLNIHGHLHNFNYGLLGRSWNEGNRYFNVSIEQINYTPISIKEIAKKMEYSI